MKLTEVPLRNTKFIFPFPAANSRLLFFSSSSSSFLKPSLVKPFTSIRSTTDNSTTTTTTTTTTANNPSSSSPWLNSWSSPPPNPSIQRESGKRSEARHSSEGAGDGVPTKTTAIDRIVLRLRNLGLGSDDDEEEEENEFLNSEMVLTGDEKLRDLLRRDWVRPDKMLIDDEDEGTVLPWEREQEGNNEEGNEIGGVKKRTMKAPTLAELTLEDSELRRLRTVGTMIRERITVPKAGITAPVLEKIHDQWRKSELVRLKFHEVLARDMKTAHEIVQRRTGGLVIWQSGSVMMVFRGVNYAGPCSRPQSSERDGDALFVPDVSSANNQITRNGDSAATSLATRTPALAGRAESMTEEEAEFSSVLDGLGPRFYEWWGTGILPVDADLLPQTIPGFKTPFRLLPTGMRPRLTNAEMTNLRKLAKSLPCHFALGRNRNHQGLAAAIVQLWEKSMVAKIAVKRGIQNTNNELMAEELKRLTGGVLLLRNKYYIVIYRGKDFVPTNVATALAERQEMTKEIQDAEEKVRNGAVEAAPSVEHGETLAGSLAEFYQAQAQWGREKTSEEQEKMIEEASKTKITRVVKKLEHKLFIAQSKRLKADKELAKIRESWLPSGAPDDQETITDEERVMFRRIGLRMKPYLPLGIRGVFDGVIENMHLHWKHREVVKLISKQKDTEFVEETARFLEFESGGILIDIVRVPKGYAIIYYRGKNYQRPISIRPRNLPSKARALKRWKALQRYEALTEHVGELENTIKQMKAENGGCDENEVLASQGEDEISWTNCDDEEEDEDLDWENEDDDSS
ncbi:CRM-domain containing factor CFM3, chloroplastic/mitochondrial isoform X2 [Cynara cardunculus var. scolymus]|uniref:RNA-binding, CRM domain-containing protein n=1 Tax=Cynara cardunculus var. scolymus TaxID=59895 RepID=A0A118K036_CYNCS|nr:CRM-domain containing factor CFM3, chloroplastic/mitochondrial isoform X2 [Cynara cardunculus var. scolymus]KVI00855.1 RNA-binding, CRM domain-containing protein [Cynara cardunculus var. scolymus]